MNGFLEAVRFLTIIPAGKSRVKNLKRAPAFFPAAGLCIGILLACVNMLLSSFMNDQIVVSSIIVVLLIVLTRGLHCDGLADTCDAFLSSAPRKDMLAIMRDPHIGVMGVLGLISVMLLKVHLLASLMPSLRNSALIGMCVLSRYAMVFTLYRFAYARDEGKAKIFFTTVNHTVFFSAAVFTLICAGILFGMSGIVLLAMVTAWAYALALCMSNKLNGLTGDSLGAINEISEVLLLLLVVIAK